MAQNRNLAIPVFLLLVVSAYAVAQRESTRMKNRRALVQMEKDFAKAAAEKGTRAAFLEFLADDGVLFQPAAVNGKKYWSEREPRKGLLSWQPAFADVSRAADLGYTTGPWEYRPNGPDDKPVAFGEYFTIWKKQGDGSWKVALDRGVSTDRPFPAKVIIFSSDEEQGAVTSSNLEKNRAQLLKMDEQFSNALAKKGTVAAFDFYFDYNVRLLRQGIAPVLGKAGALTIVTAGSAPLHWQPTAADAAKSGDLGYTYGAFESGKGASIEHGSYVRVWKNRSGMWQVVVDVMSPDPK